MQVGRSAGLSASVAVAVAVAFVVGACGVGPPASVDPSVLASSSTGAAATSSADATTVEVADASPDTGATAGASATAGATSKPVASVKGTGFMDSKRFKLKAGSFMVRWTLTSAGSAGCSVIGALHSPDGKVSVEVANTTLAGKGSASGQKATPKLKAGTYLVTFATTCAWTAQVYAQ